MRQENAVPVLTPESIRTIAGVDGKFFIVESDGSIETRNSVGHAMRWVFNSRSAAESAAKRRHAFVWDKAAGRFL